MRSPLTRPHIPSHHFGEKLRPIPWTSGVPLVKSAPRAKRQVVAQFVRRMVYLTIAGASSFRSATKFQSFGVNQLVAVDCGGLPRFSAPSKFVRVVVTTRQSDCGRTMDDPTAQICTCWSRETGNISNPHSHHQMGSTEGKLWWHAAGGTV
jgi:hypothetical protein